MQIGHQGVNLTMGIDQIIIHIPGMGRGVTDARKPIYFCEGPDQTTKPPFLIGPI